MSLPKSEGLRQLIPPELFQHARREVYPSRGIIMAQGELADRFWYLESGLVKISMYTPEGFEKIVAHTEPGSIFGEPAFVQRRPHWATAQAMKSSVVYAFARELVDDIIRRCPAVADYLAAGLAHKVWAVAQQMVDIACATTELRVVRTLVELARRQPGEDGVTIRVTHEQLASLTATSRATVTRILNTLEAAGLIYKLRSRIYIPDPRTLAAPPFPHR